MYCCSVNSFDFARNTVFPAPNRTSWQNNKTFFALIMHLLPIRATTSCKMLLNNKFKTKILTGNPAGNLRCHVLALRALNMSYCSDQSARSMESRCVVKGTSMSMSLCSSDLYACFSCISLVSVFSKQIRSENISRIGLKVWMSRWKC